MKRFPHRTPSDDGCLPHPQSPVPASRRIRFTPWAWPLATLATALCFLLGISAVPASADSGTFYATRDTSISELDPDVPHDPTTHLDSRAQEILFRNLKRIPWRPSILIISHDEELADICDKTYFLRDGRLRD